MLLNVCSLIFYLKSINEHTRVYAGAIPTGAKNGVTQHLAMIHNRVANHQITLNANTIVNWLFSKMFI